jgi:hypothetical protein
MLNRSDVATKCGNPNGTSASSVGFSIEKDKDWLWKCFCPPPNKTNSNEAMTYYWPILGSKQPSSKKCPSFKCDNADLIVEHECSYGNILDFRSLFSEYTP